MNATLSAIMKAELRSDAEQLAELGIKIGKLYTDHGLPIDMALDRLPINEEQKLVVLNGACQWLIEHKRNSGATDAAIERQRTTNRTMIEAFLATGETGVY